MSATLTDNITLARYRRDAVDLDTAVGDALPHLGQDVVALLSSPRAHRWARVDEGALCGHDGARISPESWYEARVFGSHGELRWRRPIGGQAFAVLVLTSSAYVPAARWGEPDLHTDLRQIQRRYLLWGSADRDAADGWAGLFSSRIGTLDVPIAELSTGERVQLRTHEYVTFDEDGNAMIIDERLSGLAAARRHGVE